MTKTTRRLRFRFRLTITGLATIALIVAACGSTASSASPSAALASPSTRPTPSPVTTASPAATPAATPKPSAPAPSTVACAVQAQDGQLPSDRFTDIRVSTGATADRLTFVFGNSSLPGPASPPQGSLAVAQPPYSFAGSGAPIAMAGQHVVQIRFSGMSLSNDAGQETYTGATEIRPNLPALRHAVLYDASEGIVGWYVGYDGPGCVTLAITATDVTVTIDHS